MIRVNRPHAHKKWVQVSKVITVKLTITLFSRGFPDKVNEDANMPPRYSLTLTEDTTSQSKDGDRWVAERGNERTEGEGRSWKQSIHKAALKDKSARSIGSKTVSNPALGLLAPLPHFTFIIDNQWLAGRSLSGGCVCREPRLNVSIHIRKKRGDELRFMCLLFETSLKS